MSPRKGGAKGARPKKLGKIPDKDLSARETKGKVPNKGMSRIPRRPQSR